MTTSERLCRIHGINNRTVMLTGPLPSPSSFEPPRGKTNNLHRRKQRQADQLRGNREADQRLCFRYSDSTIPLLLKSEISSFYLLSVLVQVGLCRTCSETTLLVFPRGGSFIGCPYFSWLIWCFTSNSTAKDICRRETLD